MKLSNKILLITICVLFISLSASGIFNLLQFQDKYSESLLTGGYGLGQSLNSVVVELLDLGLPLDSLAGLNAKCKDLKEKSKNIAYVGIFALNGKTLYHSDPSLVGKVFSDAVMKRSVATLVPLDQKYVWFDGEQCYDVTIPIIDSYGAHLGLIRLGFPVRVVNDKLRDAATQLVVSYILTFALIALLINYFMRRVVSGPVTLLARQAEKLSEGDFDVITHVPSKDEIGVLAQTFNNLSKTLKEQMDSLRESGQRFETLVANIPGVTYRRAHDASWTAEYVSDQIAALSGWPAVEFIRNARGLADIVHPEDKPRVDQAVDEAVARMQTYAVESRLKGQEGSQRWIFDKGQPVFDAAGAVLYLDGVIVDISDRKQAEEVLKQSHDELERLVAVRTQELEAANLGLTEELAERRRAEAALKESEETFRRIFEDSSDAILLLKDGHFVACNQATLRMLGHASKDAILQRRPTDLSPLRQPDGRLSVEAEADHVSQALRQRGHRFEWAHLKADGSEILADISLAPVQVSGEEVLHVTWRDITAKKKAEWRIAQLGELRQELIGSGDFQVKLARITDQVVDIFDADFARIWMVRDGDLCESGCIHVQARGDEPAACRDRSRCLHLLASSGRYVHLDGGHRRVPLGAFKIGRLVAGEGRSFLSNDVVNDPKVHDRGWARALGLVAFAGFGLMSRDGAAVGVLALFSKRVITAEEENHLRGLAATTTQVIQAGLAEEALIKSEERFRALFEWSRDAFMTIAPPSWRITSANPAALSLFGAPSEERIRECGPWDISPERQPDGEFSAVKARRMIETAMREGSCAFEWRHMTLDGAPFSAAVLLARVELGSEAFIQATVRDITEQKRAEQAIIDSKLKLEEANRVLEETLAREKELAAQADAASVAKSEFLANMSHEIRTPLNAVIGLTGLAMKTELSAKQKDYLKKTQMASNSLLRTINDILDFSKIEAGRLEMEITDFALSDVMNNVSNLLAGDASAKGLELCFSLGARVPRLVTGDPYRLEQVLLNLASNAVKFTDKGEVVVRADLAAEREGSASLVFQVRDTGIGVAQEQVRRLFEPFLQADSSTTRKYGGTGLGLAICRRIVEMMGGTLSVQSESDVGSVFSFTAEFGVPDGGQSLTAYCAPEDLAGARVLVVDDSESALEVLCGMLESFNFRVDAASSGEQALRMLEQEPADDPYGLIVLDWRMPGLDGLESARIIRSTRSLAVKPLIIMVSAYARQEIMARAKEVGVNAFLINPVNESLFFNTIMEVFGRVGEYSGGETLLDRRAGKPVIDLTGIRVLLAEDSPLNQQVATELLQAVGVKVDVANDGGEALAKVEQANTAEFGYDLILMDVQMPVLDGFEATRLIRGMPGLGKLPIIALTAHALKGDREKCIAAGMNDYVSKPIDSEQLYSVITRWVKHAPALSCDQIVRPAPASDSALPEAIPGLDMAKALARLGHDKALYRRLLQQFVREHSGTNAALGEALGQGDSPRAARLAHTLKSTAGSIGAVVLQGAAAALEDAMAKTEGDAGARFEAVRALLDSVLEALRQTTALPAPECDALAAVDMAPAELAGLLRSLDALLDAGNFEAKDAFDALKPRLPRTALAEDLVILEGQIDSFDMDAARQSLCKLASGLNIQL